MCFYCLAPHDGSPVSYSRSSHPFLLYFLYPLPLLMSSVMCLQLSRFERVGDARRIRGRLSRPRCRRLCSLLISRSEIILVLLRCMVPDAYSHGPVVVPFRSSLMPLSLASSPLCLHVNVLILNACLCMHACLLYLIPRSLSCRISSDVMHAPSPRRSMSRSSVVAASSPRNVAVGVCLIFDCLPLAFLSVLVIPLYVVDRLLLLLLPLCFHTFLSPRC